MPPREPELPGEPARWRREETAPATSQPRPGAAPRLDRPIYPGSELLGHDDPLVVHRLLLDGDPLDLNRACIDRLEREALVVDVNELVLACTARVAYHAPGYLGRPALALWIAEHLDVALRDRLRGMRERLRIGVEEPREGSPALLRFARAMGAAPAAALELAVRFNDLPRELRHPLYHLVLRERRMEDYLAEGHGPLVRVRRRLEDAARALTEEPSLPAPEGVFPPLDDPVDPLDPASLPWEDGERHDPGG